MSRKRTVMFAATALTGIVAAGAALGLPSASASPAAGPAARSSVQLTAARSDADRDDAHSRSAASAARQREERAERERAELNARKAKVVKAVLARFPHARVLKIALHKDGTWVVVLELKDHRIGFVTVDKRLRTSPFKTLTKRDADDARRHPTTVVIILSTPYSASHVMS